MSFGTFPFGTVPFGTSGVSDVASSFQAAWALNRTAAIGVRQMFPRNNASPERIAVGAVILIADGTVQTASVLITVVPQGGVSAAGGGTISYEQGIVFYLPTQAETNYTSFIVTAYKADCFPVSITIVTTQAATAGQVRLEGVTHTSAIIPVVSVNSDMRGTDDAFLAANVPANFSALSINGAGIVDSFLQGFLNVGITESVAGRIADNFDTLFDNANVTSTLTLTNLLSVLANTNELQTKQDAQDLIITEDRLAELDAANLPANIDALLARIIGTLAAGTHNPATAAQIAVLSDWINGGRLDLILDNVLTDTASGGIPKNAIFPDFQFPMVLSVDHYTAATGLIVTGQRSIDGAAFADVTGTISEVGSGLYTIDLSAADTNGDTVSYKFSSATADDTIIPTIITRS